MPCPSPIGRSSGPCREVNNMWRPFEKGFDLTHPASERLPNQATQAGTPSNLPQFNHKGAWSMTNLCGQQKLQQLHRRTSISRWTIQSKLTLGRPMGTEQWAQTHFPYLSTNQQLSTNNSPYLLPMMIKGRHELVCQRRSQPFFPKKRDNSVVSALTIVKRCEKLLPFQQMLCCYAMIFCSEPTKLFLFVRYLATELHYIFTFRDVQYLISIAIFTCLGCARIPEWRSTSRTRIIAYILQFKKYDSPHQNYSMFTLLLQGCKASVPEGPCDLTWH